jgi:hypothetical protein
MATPNHSARRDWLLIGAIVGGMTLFIAFRAQRKAAAAHPAPLKQIVLIGQTAPVHFRSVCSPTPEALDEITTWAARNDYEEVARNILRTHSAFLDPGIEVKTLDSTASIKSASSRALLAAANAGPLRKQSKANSLRRQAC